jgi:hypothetical protein
MREYISADFNHPGKILHKSKKMRKSVYDANNARNRDSYAVTKSNGMLKSADDLLIASSTRTSNLQEVEDTLIILLDLKNSKT